MRSVSLFLWIWLTLALACPSSQANVTRPQCSLTHVPIFRETSIPAKPDRKEEDPSGLLNEGFRYRDLETGAFITRDPMGFVDGPNLYAYVRQNPWTSFDPEGLSVWSNIWKGDFDSEEPTWGGVAGQAGVGIIPIVGQIADARDTAASIKNVWRNPKSGASWINLGGAVVGWIPVLGDAAKSGFKVGKKVLTQGEKQLAKAAEKELTNEIEKRAATTLKHTEAEVATDAPSDLVFHGTTDSETVTTKGLSTKERDKAAGSRDLADTRGFSTTTDKATAQVWADARAAERGGEPVVLEANRAALPPPRERVGETLDPHEVRIDVQDYPKVGPGVFRASK